MINEPMRVTGESLDEIYTSIWGISPEEEEKSDDETSKSILYLF